MLAADVDEIRRAVTLLAASGDVVELRALKVDGRKRTDAGYYDDFDALARDAAALSGHAPGVYVTLNRIDPALLARSANRLTKFAEATTADHHVIARLWIPLDFDAVRPAGISSTEEEHDAALDRARACFTWLVGRGVPSDALVATDSGNGAWLLIRCDLLNTAESLRLVERVLAAASIRFSDDVVTLDTSVTNAARIGKLPGTLTAKGDDTPDRPYRMACILRAPETVVVCPVEVLEQIAALAPEEPPRDVSARRGNFDLDRWITQHGLDVGPPRPWNGGTKRIFNVCPWNSEHDDDDAYIVQFASGAVAAGCQHNSCSDKDWHALREMFDPAADRVPVSRQVRRHEERTLAKVDHDPVPAAPRIWTARELAGADLPIPSTVIDGLIVEGVTLFASRPKLGKSWMCLGFGIAVAAGGYALGKMRADRAEVLYLALEDNVRRMQSRLDTMLRGEPVPAGFRIATEWPRADDGGIDLLDADLTENPMTKLVMVDTLARFRPRRRDASYDTDYQAISALGALAAKHAVAIVVVHHDRKAGAEDFIDAVSGTLGLAGAADSIMLLRRARGGAEAELHLTGRDIEERAIALHWDQASVTWTALGDAEEYRRSAERKAVIDLLQTATAPMRARGVADALGKPYGTARWLLSDMAKRGEIVNPSRGLYAANIANKQTSAVPGGAPQSDLRQQSNDSGVLHVGALPTSRQQAPPQRQHFDPRSDSNVGDVGDVGGAQPANIDDDFDAQVAAIPWARPDDSLRQEV